MYWGSVLVPAAYMIMYLIFLCILLIVSTHYTVYTNALGLKTQDIINLSLSLSLSLGGRVD